MARPFKFRYVNELAGAFVLIVLALGITGFVATWHAQGWFESTYELTLVCPAEGSFGITEGSAVEILGIRVGSVERIKVGADGVIRATTWIKGDFFKNFLCADSVPIVKKRFGLAGDAFVDIQKGTGDRLPEEGAELGLVKDTEIIELAKQLVEGVRDAVVPAIDEVRLTAAEARKAIAALQDPDGDLQQFLSRLNEFAEALQHGDGVLPKVLGDPEFAADVHEIVVNANGVLSEIQSRLREVEAILEDVKRTTAELPAVAATVRAEMEDLPGLVLRTQAGIRHIDELVAGLQKHWLVRSYMAPVATPGPLSPTAAGGREVR
jgi:phospholipid/cholesterol/gamma-HCH transport system substrate-binding protein